MEKLDKYLEINPDARGYYKTLYIPNSEYLALFTKKGISIVEYVLGEGLQSTTFFTFVKETICGLFNINTDNVEIKGVTLKDENFKDMLVIPNISIESIRNVYELREILVVDDSDNKLDLIVITEDEPFLYKAERNIDTDYDYR